MQPKRKLGNFKNLFLRANVYIEQLQINVLIPKVWYVWAVENMNNIRSQKYGYAPSAIEEKALEDEIFWEIYDYKNL